MPSRISPIAYGLCKIVDDCEKKELHEIELLESFGKYLNAQPLPAVIDERPRNFFVRLFYRPKSSGEVYGGLVTGNREAVSLLQYMARFNANQGHGYAAEVANNLADRLRLRNAKIIGQDNAKNGADRQISDWFGSGKTLIQSKYCKTGARCIKECFDENGEYRYEGMQIEVPFDKYDEAVEAMKKKIQDGKIPGVNDPEKAKEIVRQGHYTYEQAKNIAQGGNWDSIQVDAANAIVIGAVAGSLSALITFAVSMWNGYKPEEAAKKALCTFAKVCGTVAVGTFLGAQLARDGAVRAILGEKSCQWLAEKIAGEVISGDEAVKFITKNLGQAIPVITSAIFVGYEVMGEVIDLARGRISYLQLFKNLAVMGAGFGGVWGAAKLGDKLGGKIGAVLGGPVGNVAGALAGAWLSKLLLDLIVDDDSKEMIRIISFEMEIFMGDFLWSAEEAEQANKKLQDILDGNILKIMFASKDRYLAAESVIIPVFEEIAANRAKVQLPDNEELLRGMGKVIEDAEEEKAPAKTLEKNPVSVQEITFSKVYYGNNASAKSEAVNWMFMFLRLLIKDKCPGVNERILVPSAQFGKEIPAYFDGTINLDDEVEENFGFPAMFITPRHSKLPGLKKKGTLWELAEYLCEVLNEVPEVPNEVIVDEIVDKKYSEDYSEASFWEKITSAVKKAGSGLIYKALQLFYAMQNPDCPITVKGAIIAALGYFILPVDLVPDFIPVVGYTDDLAAVGAVITMANMYIDDKVMNNAKNKMRDLFGNDILKKLD